VGRGILHRDFFELGYKKETNSSQKEKKLEISCFEEPDVLSSSLEVSFSKRKSFIDV
jgi:hypothetical protein